MQFKVFWAKQQACLQHVGVKGMLGPYAKSSLCVVNVLVTSLPMAPRDAVASLRKFFWDKIS